MSRILKEPTCTGLVEAYLRNRDDFANQRMIEKNTGCNLNQVSAALFHLRKRRAIEVIIEVDGIGWWYPLPPELDTRTKKVLERRPETKPRHRRKKGEKP